MHLKETTCPTQNVIILKYCSHRLVHHSQREVECVCDDGARLLVDGVAGNAKHIIKLSSAASRSDDSSKNRKGFHILSERFLRVRRVPFLSDTGDQRARRARLPEEMDKDKPSNRKHWNALIMRAYLPSLQASNRRKENEKKEVKKQSTNYVVDMRVRSSMACEGKK